MVTFVIAYLSTTFKGISTLKAMEISHIFTLALICVQVILASLVSGLSTTNTPKYEKTTPSLKSTNTLTASTGSPGSIPVSSTPGQCNIGYFSCKDGRCEPFESLCGDVGIVTTASPSPSPTSTPSQTTTSVTMVTGHASSSSSSSPVSANSTPMTPNANSTSIVDSTPVTLATPVTNDFTPPKPTPTTPELTTTLGGPLPGPETCLPGWEDCKDGSCEPFHWLCVEHQSQAIVGR